MKEKQYISQRARLVKEFWFLKSKRFILSAKARIRKIAQLDFEFKGTPINETKQTFNYYKLKSE